MEGYLSLSLFLSLTSHSLIILLSSLSNNFLASLPLQPLHPPARRRPPTGKLLLASLGQPASSTLAARLSAGQVILQDCRFAFCGSCCRAAVEKGGLLIPIYADSTRAD